jgi:hypothetical protein
MSLFALRAARGVGGNEPAVAFSALDTVAKNEIGPDP